MDISHSELLGWLRHFRDDAAAAFALIPHACYSQMIAAGWVNLHNEILPAGYEVLDGQDAA